MTFDSWDSVVAFALTLPDTYMENFYGTPCPKVNKKAFVSPGREADSFHVMSPHDEKAVLLDTDPDTFWQTPHYEGWPGLLVRYSSADPERVTLVIRRAWWDRASKAQREAFGDRPDHFTRFAAIDWSGAKGALHKGIALAVCEAGDAAPVLIVPPGGIWSRHAILDWLIERSGEPMLIGFDFSFSAPFIERGAHLPGETISNTARELWAYADANSPDPDLGAASFLEARRGRHFYLGAADGPKRDFMHFRACESHFNAAGGGKPSTVYDAIGAAQVAKASFAGMRLLHHLNGAIPIWPFDPVPRSGAAIVEIYTTIAARAAGLRKGLSKMRGPEALDAALMSIGSRPHVSLPRYDDHATDAILTAAWLRASAHRNELWHPPAMTDAIAQSEGWTFGVA